MINIIVGTAHNTLTLTNTGSIIAIIVGVGTILIAVWRVISAFNRLIDSIKDNKTEIDIMKDEVETRHQENVEAIQEVNREVRGLKAAFKRFQKKNTEEHNELYKAIKGLVDK